MPMTPYQKLLQKVIEEDPLFDRWCIAPEQMQGLDDKPDMPGCKLFTYFTKDGVLHADRVGHKEILRRATFQPDNEAKT